MNKTVIPSNTYLEKKWHLIDANEKTLGRLASEIAKILMGKHKVDFHPAVDNGDYVVVINAKNILLSGNKETKKTYFSHSGRPGGSTIETVQSLRNRIPERILEKAVKGMLPKTTLGRTMFTRLRVFSDGTHSHGAQNPQIFNI
jgi:large subunit ribosomal protein L13